MCLQQRPDVDVEIHRVHAQTFRRVARASPVRSMRLGTVRQNATMRASTAIFFSSASLAAPVSAAAFCPQRLDEQIALLRHQVHAVGVQQLVVPERRRDRARIARIFQPGLRVVGAVAADLEPIDANRLFAADPGRRRDLGIGALELDLAARPLRHEAEVLLRGPQEIRHHRHVGARRRLRRAGRIRRPRRSGIDRRLRQHVVLEHDLLVVATLGIARAPLVGDRGPVRAGLLFELLARRPVGLELALIVVRRRLRRRCRLRARHDRKRCDSTSAATMPATNGCACASRRIVPRWP